MKTKQELKHLFENGDNPTQEDFWEWQESYWHKSEKLNPGNLGLFTYDELIYSSTDNTEVIGLDSTAIFPEGIKSIAGFQFLVAAKNRISKLKLPNSLEKIKARAFTGQYLRGVLTIPGRCKVVESYAFSSAVANVSKLILENGVETIEEGAFLLSNSTELTSLDIPDSVKFVGKNAFAIPYLKTVTKPSGLDISTAGIPSTAIIIDKFQD